MPTRSDITVINSAYDTSGNGGRKLIRLSSGNQYAVVKNGTTDFRIYKSTDNWATQGTLFFTGVVANTTDVALATNGTYIFVLFTVNTTGQVGTRVLNESATILSSTTIDTGQTAVGNCSVEYNSISNAWETTWSSKNGTYPNSFNIRYAKGTINADGSVTWSAVTQITTFNVSGQDYKNPSIVTRGTNVHILVDKYNGTFYGIDSLNFNGTSWSGAGVYNGGGYAQSSPSAIFVPQSINGLANGRIWVAWHGRDATDNIEHIRVSYSDDGGVTWSAMTKLTSGSNGRFIPSITATKSNVVSILYGGVDTAVNATYENVQMISNNSGSWGTVTTITTSAQTSARNNPSALFDLTMNISSPLFIYRHVSTKVGFYGTWTVTTISVPEGYIGTKTIDNINSLLNYSITSDGVMSTVVEKVNGVIVGQGMVSSGVPTDIMISEANWDNVKYGKYKDAVGGLNTITVEMGLDKWTYTFDKRLATTVTMEEAVKADQNVLDTFLPSVKSKLASAITSKGGTATGGYSFDDLVSAIGGIGGLRSFVGTATSTAGTSAFTYIGGSSGGIYSLTATGLPFKPIFIYAFRYSGGLTQTSLYSEVSGDAYPKPIKVTYDYNTGGNGTAGAYHFKGDVAPASVVNGSFTIPVATASGLYTYIAFG